MEKLKAKLRSWGFWIRERVKQFLVFLLISLGMATAVVYAEPKTFTWSNPTEYTTGEAYDAMVDQAGARVYCNVDPATFTPEEPGKPQQAPITSRAQNGDTATTEEMPLGTHTCFATVISVLGFESDPSNTITFTISPGAPMPPVLLEVQ